MSKKNKRSIVLPTEHHVDAGDWTALTLWDTLWLQNREPGKALKVRGLVCQRRRSALSDVTLTIAGDINASVDMTIEELERFTKDARKAWNEFTKEGRAKGDKEVRFFRHFSPDLSFFFQGPIKRGRK